MKKMGRFELFGQIFEFEFTLSQHAEQLLKRRLTRCQQFVVLLELAPQAPVLLDNTRKFAFSLIKTTLK